MFDVFYKGPKPDLFAHEQPAQTIEQARGLARTEFFWFIDGSNDLREFDFSWTAPPWEQHQTHIFLLESQYEQFEVVFAPAADLPRVDNYHGRQFLPRRAVAENWRIIQTGYDWHIDPDWAPNPYDPPFIYAFKNHWFPKETVVAEYHVPGATEYKYVDREVLTIKADASGFKILKPEQAWRVDPTWAPDPFSPPFIYRFHSRWYEPEEVVGEYHVPGATEYKYVNEEVLSLTTFSDRWHLLRPNVPWKIDSTWAPDPHDPPFIYAFKNRWFSPLEIVAEYRVPGATEYKYINEEVLTLTTDPGNWHILKSGIRWEIDTNWAPNPFDPPFIYVFGNPWYSAEEMPTAEYRVPGAKEYKYINEPVLSVKTDPDNWKILKPGFNWKIDPAWAPNPFEPPYIYAFKNKWFAQDDIVAEYHVPGATEYKYIDEPVLEIVSDPANFVALKTDVSWNIDYNWLPNPFDPPYIYAFRSKHFDPEDIVGEYRVPGATEYKYVSDEVFTLTSFKDRWHILKNECCWHIDPTWAPNPYDPPYIYAFRSRWFAPEEVVAEYRMPDATEYKYINDEVVTLTTDPSNWKILKPEGRWSIDPTWAPNPYDPPYIYVFGNPWYSAEQMPTAEYRVPGATEYKYMPDQILTTTTDPRHWKILKPGLNWNIDPDWAPSPFEPPYIYAFKNKWFPQDDIVAEYHVPGATEYKYIDEPVLSITANREFFKILRADLNWKIDPDWLPNPFDPPYIYAFKSSKLAPEEIVAEYRVPGATDYKFIDDEVLTLTTAAHRWKFLRNEFAWYVNPNWAPDPYDPPYTYAFKSRKIGDDEIVAEYHMPNAQGYKYMDIEVVFMTTHQRNWKILKPELKWNIDPTWSPNPYDPPYIYAFRNSKWFTKEEVIAEYRVPGATEYKFVEEQVLSVGMELRNWHFLYPNVELGQAKTWAPDPYDQPYIYVFGNQGYTSREMPTAEYRVPGATEYKYIDDVRVKLAAIPEYWKVLKPEARWHIDPEWAPDPTSPPYIYVFGNPWYSSVDMPTVEYHVPGATEYKYCDEKIVTVKSDPNCWKVLKPEIAWDIDYSWAPNPFEPPYIYVFGNPWYSSTEMPTVEYHVPGATEYKYVDDPVVKLKPNPDLWHILKTDANWEIDPTWCPNPFEPPFIYVFGNPWYSSVEMPTVEYRVPDAVDYKYMDEQVVRLRANPDNWRILKKEADWKIDPNWAPNPFEPPYIHVFGNPWYSSIEMPTAEYHVPGATQYKYSDEKVLTVNIDRSRWKILKNEVDWEIDYSWAPNPFEPPYIYVFGNPWYTAVEMPTAEYHVPGATEYKYCDEQVLRVKIESKRWHILKPEANWQVDMSWMPNPFEPPYIYVFGNPWYTAEQMPTVEYRVPGATERKYVDDSIVALKANPNQWRWLRPEAEWVAPEGWCPNPFEPPYIYVFGNPWYTAEEMPTAEYAVPGATEYKYVTDAVVKVKPRTVKENWKILKKKAEWEIDSTWMPNPFEKPYIYVFGNPWYTAEEMPTVEYHVPGATEYKYSDEKIVKPKLNTRHWKLLLPNVDLSSVKNWVPNPFEPPYIYVFGNQWYPAEIMPTAEYHVPGATERKYISEEVVTLTPTRLNWTVPEEVNASMIDFSWVPHPKEPAYVYHFSSEYQMSVGLTYTVPGATELKFETEVPLLKRRIGARLSTFVDRNYKPESKSIVQPVSIFFVDMSNKMSAKRFDQLKLRYPDIQKIRFANNWLETIKRCLTRSKTQKFWVISSENIYDQFNFEWHAQPWQNFMTHVFGSQWQKWSNTFLINKREFERHTTWAKSLEEFPNLNFVNDQPVITPNDVTDIYYIDWNNDSKSLEQLQVVRPDIKTTRFYGSYLETLKRICTTAEGKEWIWVTSSVCDYTRFDFSWYPEPWQAKMLHVFASEEQKFGDTFYVHVPTFLEHSSDIDLLDWFPELNFTAEQTVKRLAVPEVVYDTDTAVEPVRVTELREPYAVFRHRLSNRVKVPTPNLWSTEYRTIIPVTQGGGVTLVPREARADVRTQLYDYPYIEIGNQKQADRPMDVIFISNGETNAERNWQHLKNLVPRAKRIDGVNGRSAAYRAALTASDTPWALCVFAKLHVDEKFDWNWQPDRLQAPKHYIFYARNPVNDLEYGHMAMIAYNKQLILGTQDQDIVLDYTLAAEHEVVPMMSGVAEFNDDPLMTWRTAFREVIKLKYDLVHANNWETTHRLDSWLNIGNGKNGQWSVRGAQDAVEYFNQVGGDLNKLKLSFEWSWLNELWNSKGYQ